MNEQKIPVSLHEKVIFSQTPKMSWHTNVHKVVHHVCCYKITYKKQKKPLNAEKLFNKHKHSLENRRVCFHWWFARTRKIMQIIILYLLSIISHKFVLVENYFLLYNLYHDPHFSTVIIFWNLLLAQFLSFSGSRLIM